MLNIDAILKVGFGASGGTTFTNDRIPMGSFSDNRTVTPTTGQDAMEIRFTKALNAIFIYIPTASTVANPLASMTHTQPTGTAIPFTDFIDGTEGLTQSGFIYWKPEYDANYAFTSGEEFILTFNFTNDIEATIGGVNLLFCDKYDLLREYPDLDNLLGITDEKEIPTNLIRLMESVMLEIEKRLQNSPIVKEDRQYFNTNAPIDRWDLLNINQIDQAAIFWTLGKLLNFLSDDPGDIYSRKGEAFAIRGDSAFSSVNLSVDLNDDGSLDVFEGERNFGNIEITRTL